jgi:undecaprenyl-diphosphatase
MSALFSRFNAIEKAAIVVSLVAATFLVVDPLILQAMQSLDPDARALFRSFTDLGKSGWILVLLGLAAIALAVFRAREHAFRASVAAGYALQLTGFLFASVALASLAGSLIKNIVGRARPKFFESLGPVEFQPFTFDYDYASFPSGHATTIFAFATALAILFPRARVLLIMAAGWVAASRFLIGSHYLSDALAGAALGGAVPLLLRDRLAARRVLFEKKADGTPALRGACLWPWVAARTGFSALHKRAGDGS